MRSFHRALGHELLPCRSEVLYLGGASGTTVSHVSDMVGPEGVVARSAFQMTA